MKTRELTLVVMRGRMAVCRFPPDADVPRWIGIRGFTSVTRTSEELSVVCRQDHVPGNVRAELEWALIKIQGPLQFGLTGLLDSLLGPLAKAGIPVFTISTYDTDYLMVKVDNLEKAMQILGRFCNIVYA